MSETGVGKMSAFHRSRQAAVSAVNLLDGRLSQIKHTTVFVFRTWQAKATKLTALCK